jgi:hypothetical protein
MLNPIEYLKNPRLILLGILTKTVKIYPDKFFIKCQYRLVTGKKLNLLKPQTFNEKIQWLKLYDRKPEYTKLVDKITAKEYVANVIGVKYIIPNIGIWDKFEDINFDELPNQFVLKTNNSGGSGGVIICNDKTKIDIEVIKQKINHILKKNAYYGTREFPYKNIKPRILIEKYLLDESETELKDYKFFCFNGIVKFIQVDFNRFTKHQRNIYNTEWELLNLEIKFPNNKDSIISKPEKLDTMIAIASKLSHGMKHVRVDLYYVNNQVYFGEITFYHGSGMEQFIPESWNYVFGNHIGVLSK